jgi:Carboxypeptidase regulatory-like domain/TonB dependent receptor
MRCCCLRIPFFGTALGIILPFVLVLEISAQSTASIEGQVFDQNGAVIHGVKIAARSFAIGVERTVTSDTAGRYLLAALPVGDYTVEVSATGFKRQVVESLTIEVGRKVIQDFQLELGDVSEQVTISSTNGGIERATISVSHVIDRRMVQEAPLNGRYFLDLNLLLPGSVTPTQTAFSTFPSRGVGALAINTAGNREEAVNFMINGITLNNMVFSSISFQPSIDTVQEFKVDNSTFSAEYGQNSGAVVNIATRSGKDEFHGALFEFFRNDALDARNFFNFTSAKPPPFKRNQFGGHATGPIIRNTAFFFFSYEGLRQRQGLDLNSLVLSDAQRALATDPVTVKLLELIPRPNFVDSSGAARFIGSATAPVDVDQWTTDVTYNLTPDDRLHGYYANQQVHIIEPNRNGNTIPGFGHVFDITRQVFTLNETHTVSSNTVNEIRFGFTRTYGTNTPASQLNPADFGIRAGRSDPVGLPQINVAGGALNFGGPTNFPSGRGDTMFVVSNTLNHLRGRHSLKLGGEFREFLNNNFRLGTGSFNFPSVAAFLAGTANSFSVTLGNQSSSIAQGALGFFVQDNYKRKPNLTFELGLRYEWNMTPTERYNRFIIFDPQTGSLLRVGTDLDEVYQQNNKNFQPRLGFAWDPFKDGKTSLRAAYAVQVDQPMTSLVTVTAANPPLAVPLTFSGPIRFDNALSVAGVAGLAPQTVDHDFENAYVQSWNVNFQRELKRNVTMTVGYFGSKGTHLILRRNINQPINGVRPYPSLSTSSPILPGTPLGNVTQAESSGFSSYNALWATLNQRVTQGLQVNGSYTWSKSLDSNSLSSQGVVVQNSYELGRDRATSDFDARHRVVVSAIYDLPFRGHWWADGWQLAMIVQSQSGSPVNIVTSNSTVNGVANTLRPDVDGPIEITREVDRWFDTSVFTAVPRFGDLGRNILVGPTFNNTDFSIIKNSQIREGMRIQFRAEIFDLFNHPNFGQPGNVVGTPAFGRIVNTRFPTGESGSSRQVQFAFKLIL